MIWPTQLGLHNTLIASLQRGKTPLNECPEYDTKQSNIEAPVMLEFGGIWSTFFIAIAPRSTLARSGST